MRLRPAARRDLDRLVRVLTAKNPVAAARRSRFLRDAVAAITADPFQGSIGPRPDLRRAVLRLNRSRFVFYFAVTDDAVIFLRIFHGKERRPIW
jgi:plasmid stabilization system protein ParE